ncbi:MAG: mevalonate kinase [Saprospiraceae bacterium]
MDKQDCFPAKLLLFGEYSIINNSQALAIPFAKYTGCWQYGQREEQMSLVPLANYLEKLAHQGKLLAPLDLPRLHTELKNKLIFKSTIPQGYGVGSSGALCAALYHRFGEANTNTSQDLMRLKKVLAQIESYFHGASSGTDPLVCYLQQALLIENKSSIVPLTLPPTQAEAQYQIFLLDTKMPRETEPYVQLFLQQCQEKTYQQQIETKLIPLVHQAIQHFIQREVDSLFTSFHELSKFQLAAFAPMIPTPFQSIWKQGLDQGLYKLKLCGAGGGGFILGMTSNFERTQEVISNYELIPVSAC